MDLYAWGVSNAKENTMTKQATKNWPARHAGSEDQREGSLIYRTTVIDLVSHERIGRFTFSADGIEEARQRGWRIANARFGNGIDVRIERISK